MANAGCANSTCTNATNGCATCQPTCYSKQSFCAIGSQSAYSYYGDSLQWPSQFRKDDIIYKVLPRNIFNSAFSYINKSLSKGSTSSTSSWQGTAETRDFIYADKIKELIRGINKFANSSGLSESDISKDDVIYASYFNKIRNALTSAQISTRACDTCNTDCNVTCKNCQGCVSCEGCNTCQGHTTCHSPCHIPCHTPCDTPSST